MKRKNFTSLLILCVFSAVNFHAFGGNGCAAVTGFTLFQDNNAAGAFQNGAQISRNCDLNIRADVTCSQDIQSVEFKLNGARYRVENFVPYALAGDNNGNYFTLSLPAGTYTLQAIPWSDNNAVGTQGASHTISFTVNNNPCSSTCANVTGFSLILNDNVTGAFENGAQISTNCDWNVRANLGCPQNVQSVEFFLNGSRFRVENQSPYALGGDNNGNYHRLNLAAGTYQLKAVPWSGDNASGTQGTSRNITFTVNSNSCGSNNNCSSLSLSLSRAQPTFCNSTCNGSVVANPSGGTGPYSYSWSNGAQSQTISNLCSGSYTVTVSDNAGCTKTASTTITCPSSNCASVTGFTLIQDNHTAGSFGNGDEISTNCEWNLRADVGCPQDIQSVEFRLNSSFYAVRNISPYAMGGQNNGNYQPVTLSPGSYQLQAIPWSGDNASGTQGTSRTINFTVTGNACGNDTSAMPQIALEDFADGFMEPTDIANAGDTRLFITEKAGKIRITDLNGNKMSPAFLDITDRVGSDGFEQGLLGLTFDPDYAFNKYFYVNYTDTLGNTRVSRFTTGTNANVADASSELVILMQPQPYANHNAGQLRFGPDGFLYIALGDGGDAGDPHNTAQDPTTFLGKVLRIDVSQANNSFLYSIPSSNPFVGNDNGWLEEIWAAGLRNPFRFSFDALTGDLWIGDVGQNAWEEIDFQPAGSTGGENYGWSCMEGNHFFKNDCDSTGIPFTAPVAEYPHVSGMCSGSVIGGFVYRGSDFPNMYGKYFFTDFCTGVFRMLQNDSNNNWLDTMVLQGEPGSYSTFGEDMNNELYVASLTTGEIYRLVDSSATNGAKLSSGTGQPAGNRITFSMFPNPNAGQFNIDLNSIQHDVAEIRVLNELGQQVWLEKQSLVEGSNRLSVSSDRFTAGFYTLQIITAGKVLSSKFLVLHQ